jgi:DNA-directed RNA polymerase subunit RPC12/RpoP
MFRRIEDEIGGISLSTSEEEQSPRYLSCPYCNHRAESGDMLTLEFQEYLRRFIMREYVLPNIHSMFSDFANGIKPSSHSMGAFGIKITFDYDSTMPPRPISGPEAPDMMRIDLLCCGESIKVRDGYFAINKCPYCGEEVVLT